MEQVFGSESSSGCESGWTLYLEHSNKKEDDLVCKFTYEMDDEEEEDMSMVSDASSGPQHFPEQEDECFKFNKSNNTNGKRQKIPKDQSKKSPSFLDDTASSPLFNLSNNNLTNNASSSNKIIDYSQGYSTTYYSQGKSAFEDHLGFFHPVTGAQLQQNQWLQGKRWA